MLGWLDSELQGLICHHIPGAGITNAHHHIERVCVCVCVCVNLLISLTPLNTASQNWG